MESVSSSPEANTSPFSCLLPPGVTVSELRQIIGPSSHLSVKFISSYSHEKIGFYDPEKNQHFLLFTNIDYTVTTNTQPENRLLYLNPTQNTSSSGTYIPEESNIPTDWDDQLSQTRDNLQVIVQSQDTDLSKFIAQIQKQNGLSQEMLAKFDHLIHSGQGLLQTKSQVEDYLKSHPDFQSTPKTSELIFHISIFSAQAQYQFGNSELDLLKQTTQKLLDHIHKIEYSRLPELKQVTSGESQQIALAFDKISLDRETPPFTLVTMYIPDRGWGIWTPLGNCPQQAVIAIENYLSSPNTLPPTIFSQSIDQAISSANLYIDKSSRILVYHPWEELNLNWAVFHGNDPIQDAIQTIFAAADPVEQGRTFNMLLFFSDTEFQTKIRNTTTSPYIIFGDIN